MTHAGGCQCGAVRFRVEGPLGRASICHCRMCQKAFGAFFGPFVSVAKADLTWTRGERRLFRSSDKAERGFCGDCGTPLTFEWSDEVIDLAIGAFDDPTPIRPQVQLDVAAALPWVGELSSLPARETWSDPSLGDYARGMTSYQHPDRDTDRWPPEAARD